MNKKNDNKYEKMSSFNFNVIHFSVKADVCSIFNE